MCDKVKMSKEQTPIDFESFLEQMGYSWNDFDYTSAIEGLVEQYAQAKVLEALEREFNHKDCININKTFFNSCGEFDILSASEYYETKVKPKYE